MTKREQIYELLRVEFREIERLLDAEGQAELDGKLWALAQRAVDGALCCCEYRKESFKKFYDRARRVGKW